MLMGIHHFISITLDTYAIFITFNLLKSRIEYSLNIYFLFSGVKCLLFWVQTSGRLWSVYMTTSNISIVSNNNRC